MSPKLLMRVRLAEIVDEAIDIRSFVFEPVRRTEFPAWKGGAHVMLVLPDVGRRSYSLCGDPSDLSQYRVAVRHRPDGRGGSDYLHRTMKVGDETYLTYPQENFLLAPDAGKHLFIAGGIGITSILGMLRSAPPGTQTEVHYAVRSRQRAAFLRDVQAYSTAIYSSAEGHRLDIAELLRNRDTDTHVYVCGPSLMMEDVRNATAGWDPDRVHMEPFTGLGEAVREQGEPFTAELTLSRRTVEVPASRSLLDVLREERLPVESSCEAGICGTCKVGLVGGDPEHRDLCLSADARRDWIVTCVSRGKDVLRLAL